MSPHLERIWIQVTADKKRFAILLAVVGAGLLLWLRIILVSSPSKAAAAEGAAAAASQEESPDAETERSDIEQEPPLRVVLPGMLGRDPFWINPKHFPRPTDVQSQPKEVVQLPGQTADDEERLAAQRTAALKQVAGTLKLGAVLNGGLAVIDGRTVTLGGEFQAGKNAEVTFTLVEVGERFVVIEAEGRRFRLQMDHGLS